MKHALVACGSLGMLTVATSAYAVTTTFVANAIYSDPFTILETTQMDFGELSAGVNGTWQLDTLDNVTAPSGGAVVGGNPRSGDYTLSDSGGGATIDIRILNLAASNGVTPSTPVCSYAGGGAAVGCVLSAQANPGAGGQTLTIGMSLTTDGTQTPLTNAAPSFDIQVTYN